MKIFILTSRANDELGYPVAFYSYEDAYTTMDDEYKALSNEGADKGIGSMSAYYNKPGFAIEWEITKVDIQ